METINKKYIDLCKSCGIDIEIISSSEDESRIKEENGIFTVEMPFECPRHLGYEKVLSWNIREILLPRLILNTDRLIIRRFNDADIDKCLPLLENEEDSYMDCCRSFSALDDDYYERVGLFLQRKSQYAITLKPSGEIVGIINVFADESRASDAVEIGYRIVHVHQRKGYAYEAVGAMIKLLLDDLFVDMVSAGALPQNIASIALLGKLGFVKEGIRHHAVWHETLDRPVDMQYFYKDRK